jgi:hypothetical protein
MAHVKTRVLEGVLRRHCNVNGFARDWPQKIVRELNAMKSPPDAAKIFREELAQAILNHTLSPQDYEALTDEDFDTPEELEDWLREFWRKLYGTDPIA